MTEPLTIDRFGELADAYGGEIARWPEPYRAAATRMAKGTEVAALLRHASALDEMLDAWRVARPADSLVNRVVASGHASSRRSVSRLRLWWSGIGVGAVLAGAVAGSVAANIISPLEDPPAIRTSFGDIVGQDS